ncbi:MAG: septum formation protein Maf [Ardenticatenaceae bacterium]|nr:septum formation protein Maf [Ardenticatenaceae bacterium]
MMMVRFILGSQSPRRRALLQLLGFPFEVMVADVDETLVADADPAVDAMLTAQLKARAIRGMLGEGRYDGETLLLTADTAVSIDQHILGKPVDTNDAWQMLRALRGRAHQVHTGFTLVNLATGQEVTDVHTAVVTMRDYSDDEIAAYIATGDPLDKAGAYGVQHPEFRPASQINGCFTGVMGLSVCQLLQTLAQWDILVPVTSAITQAHHEYPCPLLAAYAASREA